MMVIEPTFICMPQTVCLCVKRGFPHRDIRDWLHEELRGYYAMYGIYLPDQKLIGVRYRFVSQSDSVRFLLTWK